MLARFRSGVRAAATVACLCGLLAGCQALVSGSPGAKSPPGDQAIVGQVVDEQGNAAAGVKVRGFLTNSAPIVGNNSAGFTNVGVGAFFRRVASLDGVTDGLGYFVLRPEASGSFNVEAEAGADRKAWRATVQWTGPGTRADAGTLRLAPVGHISGRVRSPLAGVSDYSNTQIYIPGSSYVAVAGQSGEFKLSNVPAGSFDLRAFHVDLGDAALPNPDFPAQLVVEPGETAVAPTLVLALSPPDLTAMARTGTDQPTDNAAAGATVDLRGKNFGFRRGARISVQFSGSTPLTPERVGEDLVRVRVPADAGDGQVVVTVGQLNTRALPFRRIASLSIDVAKVELAPGATVDLAPSVLAYDAGGRRIVAATPGATESAYPPNVDWSAGPAADLAGATTAVAIGPTGVLSGVSAGQAVVTVKAGDLPPRTLAVVVRPGATEIAKVRPVLPAAIGPGSPAPDDAGDPAIHHDHVVVKEGVVSTFVWIPVFKAFQVVRPAAAGLPDLPAGSWVKNEPATGQAGQDWAEETFGGFYAGKYEASQAPKEAGSTGVEDDLRVAAGVRAWNDITWNEAFEVARAFHPNAHLMRDEEWTALAVWAAIHPEATGGRILGNTGQTDPSRSYPDGPADFDDPAVRFTDDPGAAWAADGRDLALTGTGTASAWAPGVNLTTHTGGPDGVYDLVGNLAEFTAGISTVPPAGAFAVGGVASLLRVDRGYIRALATDADLRRFGLPAVTAESASTLAGLFGDDYLFTFETATTVLRPARGGSWASGRQAGIWAVNLSSEAGVPSQSIGFRPCLRF